MRFLSIVLALGLVVGFSAFQLGFPTVATPVATPSEPPDRTPFRLFRSNPVAPTTSASPHSSTALKPEWKSDLTPIVGFPLTPGPVPIMEMLDVNQWDMYDIVQGVEDEEGWRWVFKDPIINATKQHVIPELCYLTPDNITIYNSFLLDRTCLKEFESVSPQCRGFRCEVARYFLEHGARIYVDVMHAASYKRGVEVIHRELTAAFEKLNGCTCGREFFRAMFRCAPFYYGNFLFALNGNDADTIVIIDRARRYLDTKSAAKFFDRLMAGLCAESGSGLCLNSIFNGLEEFTDMLVTTIEEFEDYDEGNRKFQKTQEKRCEALFGPIRAWTTDNRGQHLDVDSGEEFWELLFDKTAAVANRFYCDKRCKKTRGPTYPCCMRKMLEDDKMFDNLATFIESLNTVAPSLVYNFEWEGFYEMDSDLHRYSDEDEVERQLSEIAMWKVPERIRDAFMRTVHGAKYCEGKIVKCSK